MRRRKVARRSTVLAGTMNGTSGDCRGLNDVENGFGIAVVEASTPGRVELDGRPTSLTYGAAIQYTSVGEVDGRILQESSGELEKTSGLFGGVLAEERVAVSGID